MHEEKKRMKIFVIDEKKIEKVEVLLQLNKLFKIFGEIVRNFMVINKK